MSNTITSTHEAAISAPADFLFEVVADVARWPQYSPRAVHAEYLDGAPLDGRPQSTDRVQHWALAGTDRVRSWVVRRTLNRPELRITAEHEPGAGPAGRVEWTFESLPGEEGAHVAMRHEFDTTGLDPAAVATLRENLDDNSTEYLRVLADVGGRRKELEQLVVDFADPLFIAGSAEDAYELLYEADKWPERIPHVSRLEMIEEQPGIQFFDMDTATPDGRQHTTRSVRICLAPHTIVYKQIVLPPLLTAHTGHWTFTETPEGTVAEARHTATIKPSALTLLGPDTTVTDARRYLRRVLSANSMSNLRLAKAQAEERAGV